MSRIEDSYGWIQSSGKWIFVSNLLLLLNHLLSFDLATGGHCEGLRALHCIPMFRYISWALSLSGFLFMMFELGLEICLASILGLGSYMPIWRSCPYGGSRWFQDPQQTKKGLSRPLSLSCDQNPLKIPMNYQLSGLRWIFALTVTFCG